MKLTQFGAYTVYYNEGGALTFVYKVESPNAYEEWGIDRLDKAMTRMDEIKQLAGTAGIQQDYYTAIHRMLTHYDEHKDAINEPLQWLNSI